jgi:hypothetical protein
MRATVGIMIITIMATGCAAAQTRSIEEMVATASFVPPPSALPSMPSSQWCKVVDAALLNPHISADRREDYISVGQVHHCPHQMFMEPRKRIMEQKTSTPEEWCAQAFKFLGNPYADKYLKAALLEKARNRGCLR